MDGNIVTFPGAEQPPIAETDINARHAEAFRELENRLMDCVSMSKIAFDQICEHTKPRIASWFLRSPIHGNCWKSSRKTITPRITTRGPADCTRHQPRPAPIGQETQPAAAGGLTAGDWHGWARQGWKKLRRRARNIVSRRRLRLGP